MMLISWILVVGILIILIAVGYFLDKKIDKENKFRLPILILMIVISFFISDINTALTGKLITKTLIDHIFPPKPGVIVEPLFHPIIIDEKEYVEVTYTNIGETPLTDIFIEKKFAENFPDKGDQGFIPAEISTNYLPTKGDKGYFQFLPPNQNLSCKKIKPFNVTVLIDDEGNYYQKNEGYFKWGCMLTPLRIRFYSKETGDITFHFLYPIYGSYNPNLVHNGIKLIPYEQLNKSKNVNVYTKFENCEFIEFFADCKKGFLERNVCINGTYEPKNVKLTCYGYGGKKLEFELPLLTPLKETTTIINI